MSAFRNTSEKILLNGSEFAYDYEARAGYVGVDPLPDCFAVDRTIELEHCIVDLDEAGRVRGVETLGHPIGLGDLIEVLRGCVWASSGVSEEREA